MNFDSQLLVLRTLDVHMVTSNCSRFFRTFETKIKTLKLAIFSQR